MAQANIIYCEKYKARVIMILVQWLIVCYVLLCHKNIFLFSPNKQNIDMGNVWNTKVSSFDNEMCNVATRCQLRKQLCENEGIPFFSSPPHSMKLVIWKEFLTHRHISYHEMVEYLSLRIDLVGLYVGWFKVKFRILVIFSVLF